MVHKCPHCQARIIITSGSTPSLSTKLHMVHCLKNPKSRWYKPDLTDQDLGIVSIPVQSITPRGNAEVDKTPKKVSHHRKVVPKTNDNGGSKINYCYNCSFDLRGLQSAMSNGDSTHLGTYKVNFCPGCSMPVSGLM